ncbi:hypothetical protein pEaSNUABM28_00324 [Erwinia phage pEa_SNUABM_28]|nr:hypothetical protein pEaSNUABM28_00324 [Erwinia phage pEa_SNUABM_28]
MPTTSRPKTEDKFSRARAAKNSPERQAAATKKTPRGPSSVRPKSTADREPKIRDEERVYNLVHAILSAWKADVGHAEHTAASAGIIKVSRRKIEGALRDLKNTRFTKIPTLINDVLVYNEVCNEFGQWVYVEHDSPDWIFVRLPENSTPVIRADISYDKTGKTSASVSTSSEVLLEDFDEDEEDEIPENVEYDDEDDSDVNEEEDDEEEYQSWSLSQLQNFAKAEGYICIKDEGWNDRQTLLARILNKGAIK